MTFVGPLLDWYDRNARELPWRSYPSAYRTWVSEIMLQQTQVETVIPYFEKWMKAFPNINALANANEQEVLSIWEGLGYYSRARNLHRVAKMVMDEYDGQLPGDLKELQRLPGIGLYTAAAIASIAFGADAAAVDGNVRRVLARLFDVRQPARSPQGEKTLWALAQDHLPAGMGGKYNQALMDLGATICTPTAPECEACPIKGDCLAYELGLQEERPVKLPRKKVPHLTVTAAVILKNGRVLLAKRPAHGLLGGLWEFPGGTLEDQDQDLTSCLRREIQEECGVDIRVGERLGIFKHAYTHFKITLSAFLSELPGAQEPQPIASDELAWVALEELSQYPMGKVDRQIARMLAEGARDG